MPRVYALAVVKWLDTQFSWTHAAWKSSTVDESSQFHPKLCRNVDYLVLFQATINKVSAPVLGSGTLNHLDINPPVYSPSSSHSSLTSLTYTHQISIEFQEQKKGGRGYCFFPACSLLASLKTYNLWNLTEFPSFLVCLHFFPSRFLFFHFSNILEDFIELMNFECLLVQISSKQFIHNSFICSLY